MITKIGHLRMDPEQVMRIFADTDNWPLWMPGIQRARTLSRADNRVRLSLDQNFRGRDFHQELECRFSANQVHLRQLKGSLRRWECNWRFAVSPESQGTTITSELDIELGGIMGLITSERMLNHFLEQTFRATLRGLQQRGRALASTTVSQAAPDRDVILQVFETEQGLELWFRGETYQLKA